MQVQQGRDVSLTYAFIVLRLGWRYIGGPATYPGQLLLARERWQRLLRHLEVGHHVLRAQCATEAQHQPAALAPGKHDMCVRVHVTDMRLHLQPQVLERHAAGVRLGVHLVQLAGRVVVRLVVTWQQQQDRQARPQQELWMQL